MSDTSIATPFRETSVERKETSSNAVRFRELDALRGIAAMSVLLFHFTTIYAQARPETPFRPFWSFDWGASGVSLFFIISGFVISLTAEKRQNAKEFLVARAARLYPAYWVSVVIVLLVTALGGGAIPWRTGLVNLTMFQQLFHVPHLSDVYWTLYIEWLFYGCVTCALFLGRWKVLPSALLGLLVIDTLATFPQAWDRVPGWWRVTLFFPLLRHLYLFVFGIYVYRARFHGDRMWYGVAVVCLLNRWGKGLEWDGVLFQILLGTFFVAAVFGYLPWLNQRVMVWLGTISYSLYLTHMSFGFYVIDLCRSYAINDNVAIVVALLGSLCVAAILQNYIEKPCHDRIAGWLKTKRTLPGSVSAKSLSSDV